MNDILYLHTNIWKRYLISNIENSQTIVTQNLMASLQLTAGRSLATVNGEQKLNDDLSDIKGGEICRNSSYRLCL